MAMDSSGFAQLRSRWGAFLIDTLLFMVLWFLGALAAGAVGMELTRWKALALLAAYFGLLPATPLQGTPGKRACGIRIVDSTGKRIGLGRSLARFIASIPSIGLFGLGWVVAAFTPRRQALHDLIAGTLVVTLAGAPGDEAPRLSWPARAGAAMVTLGCAYAAYSLVFIYNAFLQREGFGEMWQAYNDYRVQVEKSLKAKAPMPPPMRPNDNVKTLAAQADGTIVLEPAERLAANTRAVFTPRMEGDRLTWTCVFSGDADSLARVFFKICDAAAAPGAASRGSSTSSP